MDVIDNRTERIFTADYAKKTIIVPKDEQVIGVRGDSSGRAIRFELLKVPDELDLSQCVIEVQYQNAMGETGRQKVMHLEESQADGTKRISFYFRPPLSLTKAAGTVYLQICGTYAYTSGSYYHWHLAPAAVEIADFFDCEDTALADPKDDLTIQIQADIASLETQMDEIKSTLDNLTGTGDEVSENMVAEIVAVKSRVTNLESGKLSKSDAQTLYVTKEEAETLTINGISTVWATGALTPTYAPSDSSFSDAKSSSYASSSLWRAEKISYSDGSSLITNKRCVYWLETVYSNESDSFINSVTLTRTEHNGILQFRGYTGAASSGNSCTFNLPDLNGISFAWANYFTTKSNALSTAIKIELSSGGVLKVTASGALSTSNHLDFEIPIIIP